MGEEAVSKKDIRNLNSGGTTSPSKMPPKEHADQTYIRARHKRYVDAHESKDPKRLMEFMDPDQFEYSDFGESRVLASCHTSTFVNDPSSSSYLPQVASERA